MKILYSIILFLTVTNYIYADKTIDSFKFKKNTKYEIEYQLTENKTKIFSNVYFKGNYYFETKTQQITKEEKESNITYKRFLEVIETDKKGKRTSHLIDYSRIIRISLILIEAKEINQKKINPLQKEDLSLQLK